MRRSSSSETDVEPIVGEPPLDYEIRRHVAAVLSRESSLGEFYRWFWPVAWEVEFADHPNDGEMIRRIMHAFSEGTSGFLSKAEVIRELECAVTEHEAALRHQVA
jgi:hypothetical protein